MLIGSVVTGWFAYYLNAYYSGPYLSYSVWAQIKDILPSMSLALGMGLIVFLIGFIPLSPYAMLPIQIVVGAIITFSICEISKLEEYIQIKNIALSISQRGKK